MYKKKPNRITGDLDMSDLKSSIKNILYDIGCKDPLTTSPEEDLHIDKATNRLWLLIETMLRQERLKKT